MRLAQVVSRRAVKGRATAVFIGEEGDFIVLKKKGEWVKDLGQLAATMVRTAALMALVESIADALVASPDEEQTKGIAIQSLVLFKTLRSIYASGTEFRSDYECVKDLASKWAVASARVSGPESSGEKENQLE